MVSIRDLLGATVDFIYFNFQVLASIIMSTDVCYKKVQSNTTYTCSA